MLAVFWIAIWIPDPGYYNKLLLGAVAAIPSLEEQSRSASSAPAIELSTMIELAVAHSFPVRRRTRRERFYLHFAVWPFYAIVLIVILGLAVFSICMYAQMKN